MRHTLLPPPPRLTPLGQGHVGQGGLARRPHPHPRLVSGPLGAEVLHQCGIPPRLLCMGSAVARFGWSERGPRSAAQRASSGSEEEAPGRAPALRYETAGAPVMAATSAERQAHPRGPPWPAPPAASHSTRTAPWLLLALGADATWWGGRPTRQPHAGGVRRRDRLAFLGAHTIRAKVQFEPPRSNLCSEKADRRSTVLREAAIEQLVTLDQSCHQASALAMYQSAVAAWASQMDATAVHTAHVVAQ